MTPNNQMQRTSRNVTPLASARARLFDLPLIWGYMDLPDCQEPFLQFMALLRS